MKKVMVQYIDVHGNARSMELLEENVRVATWSRYAPESLVSVYRLDDGGIVHIPENAWTLFGIGRIVREIDEEV